MGRFSAAAYRAAFFLIAICSSPLARACEGCEVRNAGRLEVTSAVDTAISFVVATVRKLKPSHEVMIVEGGAPAVLPLPATPFTVAEYAAAFDVGGEPPGIELPDFQHRYEWQLTYRDDGIEGFSQPSPAERLPATDVTLDDSWVFGLRLELDYGWKR